MSRQLQNIWNNYSVSRCNCKKKFAFTTSGVVLLLTAHTMHRGVVKGEKTSNLFMRPFMPYIKVEYQPRKMAAAIAGCASVIYKQ